MRSPEDVAVRPGAGRWAQTNVGYVGSGRGAGRPVPGLLVPVRDLDQGRLAVRPPQNDTATGRPAASSVGTVSSG